MDAFNDVENPELLADATDILSELEGGQARLLYTLSEKLNRLGPLFQERPKIRGEFLETLEGSINRILGSDEDNPWTRVAMVKPSPEGAPITFRQPEARGGQSVREYTLSFVQKSAVTTECWMAWLENEDLDHEQRGYQRCLILDEPEAGRANTGQAPCRQDCGRRRGNRGYETSHW